MAEDQKKDGPIDVVDTVATGVAYGVAGVAGTVAAQGAVSTAVGLFGCAFMGRSASRAD